MVAVKGDLTVVLSPTARYAFMRGVICAIVARRVGLQGLTKHVTSHRRLWRCDPQTCIKDVCTFEDSGKKASKEAAGYEPEGKANQKSKCNARDLPTSKAFSALRLT